MGGLRGRFEWVETGPMERPAVEERVMADDGDIADGRGGGRPKAKGAERPFDMWLQKQLHAMYDEIASEPLPDELLKLIDKDAASGTEKK